MLAEKAVVEFRFSEQIKDTLKQEIVDYALTKGVNVKIIFN